MPWICSKVSIEGTCRKKYRMKSSIVLKMKSGLELATGLPYGVVSLSICDKIRADQIASSNTGMAAIQLAKLAGLRVIAVADAVRHGARLFDIGVDVLVDRDHPQRAVEIIRNVTKGKLRFAMDAVGKETATHLQESLQSSRSDGRKAHLVGLTGLPKTKLEGIKYKSIPIKVFHSVPIIGETVMDWLEQLLLKKVFHPPEIVITDSGLEGINESLNSLKNGGVSGKRLVVQIRAGKESNGFTNKLKKTNANVSDLNHADNLNGNPSRIKFA